MFLGAPRLHARRKEEERLAEKRTPLPKPPPIKSDKEKEDLRKKMGLESILDVIRRKRLRWYSHVMRRDGDNWTRRSFQLQVDGRRPKGRPKKTWEQVVAEDLRALNLRPSMVHERQEWRIAIRKQPTSDPVQREKGRKTK